LKLQGKKRDVKIEEKKRRRIERINTQERWVPKERKSRGKTYYYFRVGGKRKKTIEARNKT